MQRLLALVPLAAVVLVTVACGAEAIPADDVAAAGTARVETVSRFSMGSSGETHEFRSTEVVDYEHDRSTYVDQPSGCRTITIGDVLYSEAPPEEVFAGKRWVESGGEVDVEALFERSQEQRTSADGSITTWSTIVGFATLEPGPDEYLDYLRESSGEPERIGEEDVRGVPTTRYRTTLDVRRQLRIELEAEGWKDANIERYLEGVRTTREIDVWIDVVGLARRIVTSDESPGVGKDPPDRTVTTAEYYDFGVEADIQPPPAAEVIDSEEWHRLIEERMTEQLGTSLTELTEESVPLPGTFEPTVGDPVRPACQP